MADSITKRMPPYKCLLLGDTALTVEFGNKIDPAINSLVIAFADRLRKEAWKGVTDIVPTYRSVTIHVDPRCLEISALREQLRPLTEETLSLPELSVRTLTIPVLYGGEWGPDLPDIAAHAEMSAEMVIELHSSVSYRVYMLGFSPGFPYMGTVPDPLAMPRLPTPRIRVPAGSVGIAGNQTGIYPSATAGGWRLIGRTPLLLYRPTSSHPFLLRSGDVVQFKPIGLQEFERWSREQHDAAY